MSLIQMAYTPPLPNSKPGHPPNIRIALLVNYYGHFLPNVSMELHPSNHLLWKGAAWVWSNKCEEAFQAIKGMLSSDQVLAHYDPSLPLSLAADVSAYGVGTLTSAEQKYAQVEKLWHSLLR